MHLFNNFIVALMLILTVSVNGFLRASSVRAIVLQQVRRGVPSIVRKDGDVKVKDSATRHFAEKINLDIDPTSPKVVHNIELKAGEKCVICRCWRSKKFPLCDGSHAKHNTDNSDNVGPVIISVAK